MSIRSLSYFIFLLFNISKIHTANNSELVLENHSTKQNTQSKVADDLSNKSIPEIELERSNNEINQKDHDDELTLKASTDDQDELCNSDLLKIFGMGGEFLTHARTPTLYEESYCMRNWKTCCTYQNFESSNNTFAIAVQKMKKKFEKIEELFALFKGPKFSEFIHEHKNYTKCNSLVKDLNIDVDGHNYTYFDQFFIHHHLELLQLLLVDTEQYAKKIIYFYADLTCSVCNPKIQKYFTLDQEANPSMNIHVNTCSEVMELKEYELNLLTLYQNYLKPTVEFLNCVNGEVSKEDGEEDEKNSNPHKLVSLNNDQIELFETTYETCLSDKNVDLQECKDFCKTDLNNYTFPFTHLFKNLKISLAVLYKTLASNDIEEFYKEIKQEEFDIEEDDPIEFYARNNEWVSHKMDNLEWGFDQDQGFNIFRQIMEKKYINKIPKSMNILCSITLMITISIINLF